MVAQDEMMNIPDYCKDVLALHQAWMRLGYTVDEIFVAANDGELLVQLQHNAKTFTARVPAPDGDTEQILARWATAVASYNGMPQEWREANLQRWLNEHSAIHMVAAMVAKGIYPRGDKR